MAIKGLHALFYTTEPEAGRAFIRDKLGFRTHDTGGGWLISDVPEADIGCHPSDRQFHSVSFYCDDIEGTIAELESKGVTFAAPIREEEWGRVATFELPGGGPIDLYQPKYTKG
jgi:hypothetical protein